MEGKRIAVITGANRGLGFGTARELARRGYRVVLTARSREKAEAAAAELRGEGLGRPVAERPGPGGGDPLRLAPAPAARGDAGRVADRCAF